MGRISIDEYYLGIAKAVAQRSSCLKRQYGCVIVNNREIVSTGYNGSPRDEVNCCDLGHCKRLHVAHNTGQYDECNSVHAEQNSFLSASRVEMLGGTLYLYGEENGDPIDCEMCPICHRMALNAGIKRVVYGRKNSVFSACTL